MKCKIKGLLLLDRTETTDEWGWEETAFRDTGPGHLEEIVKVAKSVMIGNTIIDLSVGFLTLSL